MSISRSLQVTAIANALVAIGHALKAPSFMNDPQFLRLPRLVAAYVRAGYLQGSGFILIIVIINYRWARNPKLLTNNLDKAIALLTTSIYWVTALWYAKEGDKITSSLVTFVGGLQLWSTFFAIK